jgi:hypothetical protein
MSIRRMIRSDERTLRVKLHAGASSQKGGAPQSGRTLLQGNPSTLFTGKQRTRIATRRAIRKKNEFSLGILWEDFQPLVTPLRERPNEK